MNQVVIEVEKAKEEESNLGSNVESVVLSVVSLDLIAANTDFIYF